MARLLGGRPITTEEQKKNDRHCPVAVAAVVGVLLVYIYLFTQVYQVVGLPSPEALAATTGLNLDYVFDDDRNVDCNLIISFTRKYNNDNERLIFFTVVTLAFLCVYFLPLEFKRPALVFWFLTAVILLYGWHAASGLLFAHLVVYLVFTQPIIESQLSACWPPCLGFSRFRERIISIQEPLSRGCYCRLPIGMASARFCWESRRLPPYAAPSRPSHRFSLCLSGRQWKG